MNYPCFCTKIFNLCSHSWQFKLLVLFITLKLIINHSYTYHFKSWSTLYIQNIFTSKQQMLSHKLSELRNRQINHKKGSKKITDLNYTKNGQQVRKAKDYLTKRTVFRKKAPNRFPVHLTSREVNETLIVLWAVLNLIK